MRNKRILELLGIDETYLTNVINENPSLRGPIIGYIAERKLYDQFVASGRTTDHFKVPDHAREEKGDISLIYKNRKFSIEVKCLQTNTITLEDQQGKWVGLMREVFTGKRKPSPGYTKKGKARLGDKIYRWELNPDVIKMPQEFQEKTKYKGQFQCDASDKRKVSLKKGKTIDTALLRVGDFDIVAAGLFSFRHKWDFAFALNSELPTTEKYDDPEVNSQLIASLVNISWPLEGRFISDPFELFDKIIDMEAREETSSTDMQVQSSSQGKLF